MSLTLLYWILPVVLLLFIGCLVLLLLDFRRERKKRSAPSPLEEAQGHLFAAAPPSEEAIDEKIRDVRTSPLPAAEAPPESERAERPWCDPKVSLGRAAEPSEEDDSPEDEGPGWSSYFAASEPDPARLQSKSLIAREILPEAQSLLAKIPEKQPPAPAPVDEKKAKRKPAITDAELRKVRKWKKARISRREIAVFTRELSVLINSGVNVERALTVVSESSVENHSFQLVILALLKDVRTGLSLPDAFSRYPAVFSSEYAGLMKAGEETGQLPSVLSSLADDLEREEVLVARVRSAMMYPAFVLGFALLSNFAIFAFLFPQIADIFVDMKTGLPFTTQVMLAITSVLTNPVFLIVIVPAVAIAVVQARNYLASPLGRYLVGEFKYRIPLVGVLNRKLLAEKFCRSMGMFYQYGISLVDGIRIMKEIFRNPYLDLDLFNRLEKAVIEGEELGDALRPFPQMPRIVSTFASIGAHTGMVAHCLAKSAEVFELEIDQTIQKLVTLIEPLAVAVLGTIILFVILAIFIPLNQLINTLGM